MRTTMAGVRKRLGLMLGDPSGIGPELIARVLSQLELIRDIELVVLGDARGFVEREKPAGKDLKVPVFQSLESAPSWSRAIRFSWT